MYIIQDMEEELKKHYLKAYENYSDGIYRFCYFKTSDKNLAEDFMQDTFLKTWKYISEGKEIDNIKAFLYKVARNLIIDYYRKKESDETSLDYMKEKGFQPRHIDSGEDIGAKLEAEKLMEIMEEIDEKYREPIIMRYVEGLSPKEIADALDEKTNVVSVRIHRGVKKVRKIIKEKREND